MSNDELINLRQSVGESISINSFLSASVSRHKALGFLNSSEISNDQHRVLFVGEVDPCVVNTKPFVDIRSLSYYADISEVLFMIGCVFRLIDIRRDNADQIWTIRMKLCSDDENDLKNLVVFMKKQYGGGDEELDLRSFGEVLRVMGKFNLAEKLYCCLLKEPPSNDPSFSSLYWSLGSVTLDKTNYGSSLAWYHKSLDIKLRTNPSDYISNAGLYNCIGEMHRHKGEENKAIQLFEQENNEDHSERHGLFP